MKKTIIILAAAVLACTAATAQELKFAHVNFQELVQLMPEMDSARVQIDAATRETQETYESMIMEYNSKGIRTFEQSSQQDLTQLQNTLMAPIYQKAQEKIQELAKAKGVIYVFDESSLHYVDATKSIDLTPEARTALNIPEGRTLESLQAELQAQYQQQAGAMQQ